MSLRQARLQSVLAHWLRSGNVRVANKTTRGARDAATLLEQVGSGVQQGSMFVLTERDGDSTLRHFVVGLDMLDEATVILG